MQAAGWRRTSCSRPSSRTPHRSRCGGRPSSATPTRSRACWPSAGAPTLEPQHIRLARALVSRPAEHPPGSEVPARPRAAHGRGTWSCSPATTRTRRAAPRCCWPARPVTSLLSSCCSRAARTPTSTTTSRTRRCTSPRPRMSRRRCSCTPARTRRTRCCWMRWGGRRMRSARLPLRLFAAFAAFMPLSILALGTRAGPQGGPTQWREERGGGRLHGAFLSSPRRPAGGFVIPLCFPSNRQAILIAQ